MKNSLLLTFALLMMVFTATAQEKAVILTAGQSNTAGRCDNANLPDYIKALGTEYQYCNWSYTNGGSRKVESEGVFRKFWPEREKGGKQFAYDAIVYYWVEQALKQDFYVVKHAMGGTSIDPTCQSSSDYHWSADPEWLAEHPSCNEGGTSMLKAFVSNIGKSLDAITAKGETFDIKCMIWHQGESDRSGTGPDGYHDNLKAVVKYVRDYLVEKTGKQKYATLPFICGTVPKNSKQYNKKVYDALFTLQDEDPNFHVIETSPGTFIGDQLHFDSNCAERLGIGMYNKMVDLGLINGQKQAVPDPILPETSENTLDFKGWTENMGLASSEYLNIILDETPIAAADGTQVFKAIGCSGDADFSEFAETFALAENTTSKNDKVRFRGANGLFLASKQKTVLSLLNLQAGDIISVDCTSGTSGAQSLFLLSENAYLKADDSKTPISSGTYLENKTEYVIASGTQLDLTFGDGNASHTIRSITIVPFQNGVEPDDPEEDDPTAVQTIRQAASGIHAPMTAITGQRVGNSYKGIVIINGKKVKK
ncbi:MAG: hypothetical protein IJV13_01735 [Prevotella sp.]|nr:hypothetical protein [Prevotella sp.]